MAYTLSELADRLGAKLRGQPGFEVLGLAAIENAAFGYLSPLLTGKMLCHCSVQGMAVLTSLPLAERLPVHPHIPAIISDSPSLALSKLIDLFHPVKTSGGVHPLAWVDPSARIHPTCRVGPHAVVEAGVRMGEECWIGPGAVIMEGTVLGCRVRIGPHAVIGYEGFGFVPGPDGAVKVRQVGTVVLEDDVEIGAGTCVDRGTLGQTIVGRGTKLDNLVQVGHNVRIGANVLIAAQGGIAGSSAIGNNAMLGGQVGVADHLTVGENAAVAARSGVTRDVPNGVVVEGYPAMPRWQWLRFVARLKNE